MKNRYCFLDGIRGLAALFVLTRHTGHYWNVSLFRSYLAVDLFFILSGFVIACAYDAKIANGTLSALEFMKIRLARLYPAFILSLLLSGACEIGKVIYPGHGLSNATCLQLLAAIMLAALFLPSRVGDSTSLYSMNGAYWSLFYELVINGVYARFRRRLDNSRLAWIAIAAAGLLSAEIFLEGAGGGGSTWGMSSFGTGITRSAFGIFAGIYLFHNKERLQHYLPSALPAWATLLAVALILSTPSFGRYDEITDVLIIIFIFPILVLIAARGQETRWSPLLIALGEISYPLYLFHIPFGQIFYFVFKNRVPAYAPLSGLLLLAVLVPSALAIARHYEPRMRKAMLSRFSTPWTMTIIGQKEP
ncbi:acyltransferase family protein [Paludibacterium yongneupense]|uniref:acyltransferase family protein n=1 Tax=Paludibacterium yongneupense TaxID=400061 RepID=UPI0004072B47|nr:acyltransferase [Paludibacterium yongneupense]